MAAWIIADIEKQALQMRIGLGVERVLVESDRLLGPKLSFSYHGLLYVPNLDRPYGHFSIDKKRPRGG